MFSKKKKINSDKRNDAKKKKGKLKKIIENVVSFVKRPIFKQIIFTIVCLFIFRLGNNIFVSSINIPFFNKVTGLSLFDMLTGSDLSSFTVFALGLSPFITASIIIELLSNDYLPIFAKLKEENQKKKNTATNLLGLVIAVIQAGVYTFAMDKSYHYLKYNDIYSYIYTVIILVAGSCIVLWLSKQIDAKGIGNGSSVIIAAGILYRFPKILCQAFDTTVTYKDKITFIFFGALILVYLGIIALTVFSEKSERRLKINFSRGAGSRQYNYLPIKLNVSSVIPVIFAASLLQAPQIICSLMNKTPKWLNYFSLEKPYGIAIYAALIIFFTFFYSHTVINAEDINKNLERNGGNIEGVRLGEETISYINSVLTRITVAGVISLLLISLIPVLLPLFWNVAKSSGLSVAGTSLIIVVSVTFEIASRLKSAKTKKKVSSFLE